MTHQRHDASNERKKHWWTFNQRSPLWRSHENSTCNRYTMGVTSVILRNEDVGQNPGRDQRDYTTSPVLIPSVVNGRQIERVVSAFINGKVKMVEGKDARPTFPGREERFYRLHRDEIFDFRATPSCLPKFFDPLPPFRLITNQLVGNEGSCKQNRICPSILKRLEAWWILLLFNLFVVEHEISRFRKYFIRKLSLLKKETMNTINNEHLNEKDYKIRAIFA